MNYSFKTKQVLKWNTATNVIKTLAMLRNILWFTNTDHNIKYNLYYAI